MKVGDKVWVYMPGYALVTQGVVTEYPLAGYVQNGGVRVQTSERIASNSVRMCSDVFLVPNERGKLIARIQDDIAKLQNIIQKDLSGE